jgi:nicotinamidase/pyrazinamidase
VSRALIIVDVQRDFLPGGALPVPDGDAVVPAVRALVATGDFDVVLATRDWHPVDHSSFVAQGGPWPEHCVQGMPGAELDPGIIGLAVDGVIDKGEPVDGPGYSGFEADALPARLREHDVDQVTIVGLATDYCVEATARDALAAGLSVTLDSSAVRGIDPDASQRALDELAAAGATVL